jgi:hypothetical protein
MSYLEKYLNYGVGGSNCPCCADAPGSKARKNEFRCAKRREREKAIKEAVKEIYEDK